ncbi:MAG: CUAEP/CCAEP-tail radical SAM protein, partial [bacterium]|nr:CUAEP/CCAEP-tail radical SAM protein [bacterium]
MTTDTPSSEAIDWHAPGAVLLASCYELGHPPLGVASPAAFLNRAGFRPAVMDVAVEAYAPERAKKAAFAGISVPMHAALRLGVSLARKVREDHPGCHICFYGHYALLNREYLLGNGADSVIGGEFEAPLLALIEGLAAGRAASETPAVGTRANPPAPYLEKLPFLPPDRTGLPELAHYAHLVRGGEAVPAGAVEASRGCKHLCRHCPLPPVYQGRFFVVPADVVLEDIGHLAAAGARHITFADPDFLNGPRHGLRVAQALHGRHPDLTFDFTTKVEHIIRNAALLPEFKSLGCLFIVSAVESLNEAVLANLQKGHTPADIYRALGIVRQAGISIRPTLVAFTPWTREADYFALLDFIEGENLIDEVDPVQLAIRLLIPPGSELLKHPGLLPALGELDAENFIFPWAHPDPRMDRLHKELMPLVEEAAGNEEDPARTFARIREVAAR